MAKKAAVEEEQALDPAELRETLKTLNDRAERAEAELAELKRKQSGPTKVGERERQVDDPQPGAAEGDAETALRNDSMMAHLMDSLNAGKDIGHYGRLVFAMVARHFMPQDEVVGWLTRDPDFSKEKATLMLRQVEGRDYNPPKRDRILAWQAEQEFPILPDPEDPDCGNLYRNLKFPDSIYHHIEEYQEQKVAAGE